MKNFIKYILDILRTPPMSDIERYVASKNPQSTGDLDYWLSRYEHERRLRTFSAII